MKKNIKFFCHRAHFILRKKIISKFRMLTSWSKDRWRSYIFSGAKTHTIAHTKGEPQPRMNKLFFVHKHFSKIIKSISICDYKKYPIQ